jgi:putative ABC transport system permease protein
MNRISTLKIALNNIVHRRFRSICVVSLVAVTTLLITGGSLLGYSLKNGLDSVNARLGADAMIVPFSAGKAAESALLSGAPATFYFTADAARRIAQTEGIERATTQLFISTFDSSHCAALVQIIGYDPATDFIITPWLSGSNITEPREGEVVIGAGLTELNAGDDFQVFALRLKVVGTLDKTGMGFDNSVFVNLETAQMLLDEYEKFTGAVRLPEGASATEVVSALLLDLKPGIDLTAFQSGVNTNFRDADIRVILSQELLTNTSKNLGLAAGILTVLLAAFWLFAVFVLAIIFTLALNERQREFGLLRVIGATKRKLALIVITESALLCVTGALVGVGAVCIIVFSYGALISRILQTTYLPPTGGVFAAILVVCFALGAVIGPLASLFSAARIGKLDAFENLREGI